jgi:hypothetical protein
MKLSGLQQTILSLLVIAFCFLFPHFGGLSDFYLSNNRVICCLAIFKIYSKENFTDLFFSFRRFEFRAVWVGAIAAILLSLFFHFAWHPLINNILPDEKNRPVGFFRHPGQHGELYFYTAAGSGGRWFL